MHWCFQNLSLFFSQDGLFVLWTVQLHSTFNSFIPKYQSKLDYKLRSLLYEILHVFLNKLVNRALKAPTWNPLVMSSQSALVAVQHGSHRHAVCGLAGAGAAHRQNLTSWQHQWEMAARYKNPKAGRELRLWSSCLSCSTAVVFPPCKRNCEECTGLWLRVVFFFVQKWEYFCREPLIYEL